MQVNTGGIWGEFFWFCLKIFVPQKAMVPEKKPGPWMAEPGHMFESVGSR